ncbi:MAG: hypothetical protein QME66_00605 [Candidatus Eisenbacteria bacterium]|nr:hypothetical protein [Candidatus Eisenbacteria bacterium]
MGLAQQFTNLGEDMIASYNERVNFLGKNIVDTHRLLGGFRKDHKAMGRKLRSDLAVFPIALTETVDQMLSKFRKEHREAHRAWQQVARTMASKRHNFNAALTKAKQSAARTR